MNRIKKGILIGLSSLVIGGAVNAQELTQVEGERIVNKATADVFGRAFPQYEMWFTGPLVFDSHIDRMYVNPKMNCREVGVDYNEPDSLRKKGLVNVSDEFRYVNMPAFSDSVSLYNATVDTLKSFLE
jgi:hypothetical protein